MNIAALASELASAKRTAANQRIISMALAVSVVILAAGWMREAYSNKVIVVPPVVTNKYELGVNYANSEYLTDMASYVLTTLLTVSPKSAEHNNDVILKMATPDAYANLKTTLSASAIEIKKNGISTIWEPRDEWEVSDGDMTVQAKGLLTTYIQDVKTSVVEKEYLVGFSIANNGRIYVTHIQEVVKPNSRAN